MDLNLLVGGAWWKTSKEDWSEEGEAGAFREERTEQRPAGTREGRLDR
jgi:hypothetical protein